MLLPAAPNRVMIGESAPDSGWRGRVATIGGPRLFALGGLTMYLDDATVRNLVTGLADRCPGSNLLIDTADPRPGRLAGTGRMKPAPSNGCSPLPAQLAEGK